LCIFGVRDSFGKKEQHKAREECNATVAGSDLISVPSNRILQLLISLLADILTLIRTSAGNKLYSKHLFGSLRHINFNYPSFSKTNLTIFLLAKDQSDTL